MEKGLVIDVPAAFGLGGQHTYFASGPEAGIEGPGRTRIDTIFANQAAMAIISHCRLRWDLTPHDNVPVQITISMDKFKARAKVINTHTPFPIVHDPHAKKETPEEAQTKRDIWKTEFNKIASDFNASEQEKDVEGMHRAWCEAAVQYLKTHTGTENQRQFKHASRRAEKPTSQMRTIAAKPNPVTFEASNEMQRRLMSYHKRLKELSNQLTRQEQKKAEGNSMSDQAAKHTTRLWHNICESAVNKTPFTKAGIELKPDEEPKPSKIVKAIEVAWKMLEKEAVNNDNERRKKAADKMKADLRHGGAIAHRAIKTVQGAKKEWTPPTRTVKLENGTLSSNPQDVQGEFVRQWAEKGFQEKSHQTVMEHVLREVLGAHPKSRVHRRHANR